MVEEIEGPDGITYSGYRDHDYDFGLLVSKQNDRVMDAGKVKHKSAENLNTWIDSINDLEDLLTGFWMDTKVKTPTNYRETLRGFRPLSNKTKEDKIILGHLKLRALMKLQYDLGFMGMKRIKMRI